MLEHATVSVPAGVLMSLCQKILPPVVVFGSPVQREKNEANSYWHIPVQIKRRWKIGPSTLPRCQAFLDRYQGDSPVDKIRMAWGDKVFGNTVETVTLVVGEVLLVPIACRSEEGDDRRGYISSLSYILHDNIEKSLEPDRKKNKIQTPCQNADSFMFQRAFLFIACSQGSKQWAFHM